MSHIKFMKFCQNHRSLLYSTCQYSTEDKVQIKLNEMVCFYPEELPQSLPHYRTGMVPYDRYGT